MTRLIDTQGRRSLRHGFILLSLGAWAASGPVAAGPAPQAAPGACVEIGSPKPTASFVYRYTDSSGTVSDYTNQWLEFTPTSSRLQTTKTGTTGPMVSTYVGTHRIENDMLVLLQSVASGTDPNGPFKNTTTYSPGIIGDSVQRACRGQTVTIPAVSATMESRAGKFSIKTDPGTLNVIAIDESITVPAGTFATVRYTRSLSSGRGAQIDEFWKSTVHGVTVKHTYTAPGVTSTELLQAIK